MRECSYGQISLEFTAEFPQFERLGLRVLGLRTCCRRTHAFKAASEIALGELFSVIRCAFPLHRDGVRHADLGVETGRARLPLLIFRGWRARCR